MLFKLDGSFTFWLNSALMYHYAYLKVVSDPFVFNMTVHTHKLKLVCICLKSHNFFFSVIILQTSQEKAARIFYCFN